MSNLALPPLRLAVVGAGPVGLALALLGARLLPDAEVTLFDARAQELDVSADPRTLALALGSVHLLERLNAWDAGAAQPILEVHVSQAPPTLDLLALKPQVLLRAGDERVPMLGAVLSYGALVAPMQRAWEAVAAAQPKRLRTHFGQPVVAAKNLGNHTVELDAGIAEVFDLAVVAEGGVFADPTQHQGRLPKGRSTVRHDYHQTAWVGTVTLDGAIPGRAIERFTRDGPVALLPLRPAPEPPLKAGASSSPPAVQPLGHSRAALVWCVNADDDPVRDLSDAQRAAVLRSIFPDEAGCVLAVSPLKSFALALNAERTLVGGRQVRIGNAAQTLHPVAGQGLNLGLRDAVALVQALRDVASREQIDAALRTVEWQRGPDRWQLIAATDFLARSFTWRWPGLGAVRGLGLAALDALPPLKSALVRQMMFGRRY